ncbi:DNA repair xp-C [Babesia ovis]|uniref:DNA repair xp-C n=1 Tax=Babesia ovis TaxID=5869 RepID=A0A9W5TAG2_BABOV|nr:DNA repair xp-C [Babesia ovis]
MAEAFDTATGSWKRVDFGSMTYEDERYEAQKTSKPLNPEHEVVYTPAESDEYKGHIYVQRQNKIFVYRKGKHLTIVAIIILRGGNHHKVLLNTSRFPFEEDELKKRLVQDKRKGLIQNSGKEYIYVFGCNAQGYLSEITPKYVERYNDACIKRGKAVQQWLLDTLDRLNEPLRSMPSLGLVSLLERAEQKWMQTRVNNDPLPQSKAKFKNHPIYILASQIGNNRIRKKEASPVAYVKGEEVYLRSDFEELKTRSAWARENRRVLEDAQPVTTRRMYNKNTRMYMNTDIYKQSQTELIPQTCTPDGKIDTTEYDNVDCTGQRFIPEATIYLKSKKPEMLIKTARTMGIYYKRAFSAYQKNDTFKPEIDGIVIRKNDLKRLLEKYQETALEAAKAEHENKANSYRNYWRSVFKTMLAEPPSIAQQQHRKIRKELGEHVSKFLNTLEHSS